MPLYDYNCDPCDDTVEVRHGINEDPAVLCEKCEGPMERLISVVPIRLDDTFPGARIKTIDARIKKQETRLKDMVENGKLEERDVDRMAEIRDEFATDSPYTLDPTKDGKQDPHPEEAGTGHFDDQLEV